MNISKPPRKASKERLDWLRSSEERGQRERDERGREIGGRYYFVGMLTCNKWRSEAAPKSTCDVGPSNGEKSRPSFCTSWTKSKPRTGRGVRRILYDPSRSGSRHVAKGPLLLKALENRDGVVRGSGGFASRVCLYLDTWQEYPYLVILVVGPDRQFTSS